jgi:flagellar biosynthetic protein FlhB
MAASKHDKTESPTQKRKKDARRDGRVARSPDLVSWLPGLLRNIKVVCVELLGAAVSMAVNPDPRRLPAAVGDAFLSFFTAMLPALLGFALLAIVANLAQVGFIFTGKPLKPKLSHLNPLAGLKRMFSVKGLWQAFAAALKLAVIGVVVWVMLRGVASSLTGAPMRSTPDAVADLAKLSLKLIQMVAAICVLLGLADYAFKRRTLQKELRMSKHEIRQEYKDSEGDPQVRSRMRSNRLAMSRNRMIGDVSGADVVVTNPTHFAVALAYDRRRGAPRVVARGADAVAARIRAEAFLHGVPCIESRLLARTLFRLCRPGEEIPAELYQAVASVLAFVHRLGESHRAYASAVGLDVLDSWSPSGGPLERVPPRRRRTLEKRATRAEMGQTAHGASVAADGVR